jgi:hypothetical protein
LINWYCFEIALTFLNLRRRNVSPIAYIHTCIGENFLLTHPSVNADLFR